MSTSDEEFIDITVQIPIEDITAALEEAEFTTTNENIHTVAAALGDKWMTDITEVNELDFIIEVCTEDLEPDENNEKGHRDWRMRQGS